MDLACSTSRGETPAPSGCRVSDVLSPEFFESLSLSAKYQKIFTAKPLHLPQVHPLTNRHLNINISHNSLALRMRTLNTEHLSVLSTSRERRALDIAFDPFLKTSFARIDQVVAVWAWVIIRELFRNAIGRTCEAGILLCCSRVCLAFLCGRCHRRWMMICESCVVAG